MLPSGFRDVVGDTSPRSSRVVPTKEVRGMVWLASKPVSLCAASEQAPAFDVRFGADIPRGWVAGRPGRRPPLLFSCSVFSSLWRGVWMEC